jgi:hypothetical protein
MLSHDLILDAAEAVVTRSRGPVGPMFIQRKVRVGWATALHLIEALQSIGVLGPSDNWRHEVLPDHFDRGAVLTSIDAKVAAGRITLDGEPCPTCRATTPKDTP